MRIEVPSLLVGRKVNDITVIGEINVVSISRNNKSFIPTLGTILEADDTLYISVSHTATDKLKAMFDLN
jgi:trk system potassium uptake protein TrkA